MRQSAEEILPDLLRNWNDVNLSFWAGLLSASQESIPAPKDPSLADKSPAQDDGFLPKGQVRMTSIRIKQTRY